MNAINQNATRGMSGVDSRRYVEATTNNSRPSVDFQGEKVNVLELRRVNAGNLKAFVTVQVDRLIIHSCRVIQQEGKAAWVSLPQSERDGKYFPVVETSHGDLANRIKQAVLTAYCDEGKAGEDQI